MVFFIRKLQFHDPAEQEKISPYKEIVEEAVLGPAQTTLGVLDILI